MVGQWSKRNSRLQYNIGNLKQRLKNAEQLAKQPQFEQLMKYINQSTYTFINQQIRLHSIKPKAKRFNIDEKILSLALYKSAPKGYKF